MLWALGEWRGEGWVIRFQTFWGSGHWLESCICLQCSLLPWSKPFCPAWRGSVRWIGGPVAAGKLQMLHKKILTSKSSEHSLSCIHLRNLECSFASSNFSEYKLWLPWAPSHSPPTLRYECRVRPHCSMKLSNTLFSFPFKMWKAQPANGNTLRPSGNKTLILPAFGDEQNLQQGLTSNKEHAFFSAFYNFSALPTYWNAFMASNQKDWREVDLQPDLTCETLNLPPPKPFPPWFSYSGTCPIALLLGRYHHCPIIKEIA